MPIRSKALLNQVLAVILATSAVGCQWEPSQRELHNARAFEALLTAVSLKNAKELEADAKTIEARHASGELSEEPYTIFQQVIEKGRAKDWAGAEKLAYDYRSRFGDEGAYFK